jgi:hypothetical protein
MLTTTLASLIMTDMQKVLIQKLESETFIYPSVIIMDTTKEINVDAFLGRYSCVLSIWYTSMHGTNVLCISNRNRDEQDDKQILQVIKDIVCKHQPEGVGYFAQCLYKPMTRKEYASVTTDDMNRDPDAFRVFHNCFFTKYDKRGYLLVTPYLLKDYEIPGTEEVNKDIEENLFDLEDTKSFAIAAPTKKVCSLSFHTEWEVATDTYMPRIENPYV